MRKLSSKLAFVVAAALVACMMTVGLAFGVEQSGSLTKIDEGQTSYTTAAGANVIALKKDTTNVIWSEVELTSDERAEIVAAFADFDGSWKTDDPYCIFGYGTFDLSKDVIGSKSPWGSWTVTKNADGAVTLASEDDVALSHICYGTFVGLANAPTEPTKPPAGLTDPTDKVSKPSIDKDISSDGVAYDADDTLAYGDESVKPGDSVWFRLTSNLPEGLEKVIDGDGEQTMVFTDTMSDNLMLDPNSVAVRIGDTTLDVGRFAVSAFVNQSFTVTLDLKALYDAGVIDPASVAEVVVTYSATVSQDAVDKDDFDNTALVAYNDDPTVESKVTGTVKVPPTPPTPDTGSTGALVLGVAGIGLMAAAGMLARRFRKEGAE